MLAFLIRRIIGAFLVCIAVTFIVFVIFIVVPGGDPAQRIGGKNATPQLIENIRHTWGFDRPFYVQYWVMMKKMFSGELISYTNQQNVVSQIVQGIPATFSLTIGASIIWLFFGIVVGVISAVTAGRWSDRVITASPPARVTASAIARASVATATGPMPAAHARRQTCTIIGSPAMSASGFPGRRCAPMRAGMMTMGSDME